MRTWSRGSICSGSISPVVPTRYSRCRGCGRGESSGIVKNDAERETLSPANAAHAVTECDAVHAPRAAHRPPVHREDHGVALPKRHHLCPRLHARALLGQHELTACEVLVRAREQHRDLERKRVLAVQVLVKAIVVVRLITQQQRGGAGLAGRMAAPEEGG